MKFFNRKKKPPPEQNVLDSKTLLKLARQHIDEKNLKEAQKCCKKVLKKNNQNYIALVLLGKSLGNSEEALKTYNKAVELKPDNPLAWQGVANYYESKDDTQAKNILLTIYTKILTSNVEDDYAMKTLKKLGHLGCLLKNSNSISTILEYLGVPRQQILIETAEQQFLNILSCEVPVKSDDVSIAKGVLKKINNSDSRNDITQILLGKLIIRSTDFSSAVIEITELEIFSKTTVLREWLCELLCKSFFETSSFCGLDIEIHLNKLISGVEGTKYGILLQAIMHYRLREYVEAFQKSSFLIESDDIDKTEAVFVFNCSILMGDITLTENISYAFLKKQKLKGTGFFTSMNTALLSTYIVRRKLYHAICILKKIPIEKLDSFLLSDMVKLFIESKINISLILNILKSTDYFDLYKALACIKLGRYEQAVEALRDYNKHPLKYYYIAQAYWKINLFSECLQNLQTAIEFIPTYPKVYYCLGIYYFQQEKNTYQSIEYFEKSYNLCSTDIKIIKMLCVAYDDLLYRDLELNVLLAAVKSMEIKDFWIYTRLGRIYFLKGEMDDALMYLQEAINLNPQDATAQEWIGDIFYNKKSYEAALASYEIVIELSNDIPLLINCLNRIGSIYSTKRSYDKAIFIFDKILQVDPENIDAVKGLNDNRVLNGRKKSANYLFRAAREELQKAIDIVSSAMTSSSHCMIYFHLYGDALVSITRLPPPYCYLTIRNAEGETRIGKTAMYEMAIANYSELIRHRDAYALFKCAHTYLEYYITTKRINYWHTSYNLAVLSIKARPNAWRYWDLLGKICYFSNKNELAHFSFFKAIILNGDKTAHKVWCNLGTFYLKINKDRLASYCYAVGRKCLPSYPTAWIGDGLLAEIIREDGNVGILSPDPNSNEFEVISELDFIDWVTTIHELSIPANEPSFDLALDAFFIVPYRMDLIEWYLSFEQHTVWGCIALGYLQEEKGFFSYAATFYHNAFMLADAEQKSGPLLHMSRVIVKLKRYDEAIKVFNGINEVNFRAACNLGRALYKEEHHRESYAIYRKALQGLYTNNEELVKVLLALANVSYKIGGCIPAVKFLFRASRVKSGSRVLNLPFLKSYAFGKVHVNVIAHAMAENLHSHADNGMWWYHMGLNYLCGHSGYAKLASLCVQRAIDLALNSEYAHEIGKMHAMISIAEFYSGDRAEAMEYAKRALNVYPGQSELWAALILCVFSHREWPHRISWISTALYRIRQHINLSRSINEWLRYLEERLYQLE